jgi:hypothetical protein
MMTAGERQGNYQLLAYNEHHISRVTHTVICQSSDGPLEYGVYIYHYEVEAQSDNYRTCQKNKVIIKVVVGTLV